jgi:hypothetical protein
MSGARPNFGLRAGTALVLEDNCSMTMPFAPDGRAKGYLNGANSPQEHRRQVARFDCKRIQFSVRRKERQQSLTFAGHPEFSVAAARKWQASRALLWQPGAQSAKPLSPLKPGSPGKPNR